jgi:CRISPR-associated protein Cmr6
VSRNAQKRGTGRQGGPPGPGELPTVNGEAVIRQIFGDSMIPRASGNQSPNPGLVFQRYLRIWQPGNRTELVEETRSQVLQLFVDQYAECGRALAPFLSETHSRLDRLGESVGAQKRSFRTQERFASGLGAAHPLENGLTLDYALGVPYLAGSSIKGLALQYSYYELDEDSTREELFGRDVEDDRPNSMAASGDVVFFPAYPERWPRLEVDVINCHYSGYYGQREDSTGHEAEPEHATRTTTRKPDRRKVGPREYESPVPVFLLTVQKDGVFVFRCGSRTGNVANVEMALNLLRGGLQELGIGAKTALGYGVMA